MIEVDADEKIELLHRRQGFVLIRKGDHGIAAQANKRFDLAFALEQDFIIERRGGHLPQNFPEAPNSGTRALSVCRIRLKNLCLSLAHRLQNARVGHPLAQSIDAPTNRVQRAHQVLSQDGSGRHIGSCPGHRDTAFGARKGLGCKLDVARV